MATTKSAWIDPADVDPLATHLKRQSDRTRDRDAAMLRLLADAGLKPGEIAGDDADTVVTVGDVRLTRDRPTPGWILIRGDVAVVGPDEDVILPLRDAATATALARHLTNLEDASPEDPLFASAKGGPLSRRHVREIVTDAAESADVRPQTPDGHGPPSDVRPLTLRATAAYRQLRDGADTADVAEHQRLVDARSASYYLADLVAAARD